MAFLGYGAAGSFLNVYQNKARNKTRFLSMSAALFSLSVMASFLLCNNIPFDLKEIAWNKNQIFFVFLFYLLLAIPFFFSGCTISFAMSRWPAFADKIYFYDLLGAGAGTIFALLIFHIAKDRGTFLTISVIGASAAFLFTGRGNRSLLVFLALLFSVEIGMAVFSPSLLEFRISPYKALPTALRAPGARSLFTKWNALSRMDVITSPAVRYAPGLSLMFQKDLPQQLGLARDGSELNAVTRFSPAKKDEQEFLDYLPASLAYQLISKPETLVIDPMGGLDVLSGIVFEARRIDIIESHPLAVDIMKKNLSDFSGLLYKSPDVQIFTSQARTALRETNAVYDHIVFSLTDVFGSSSSGFFGFGENHLYTLESFSRALQLLSPRGFISMTRYLILPPREEIRLLATWIQALEKSGNSPSRNLVVIRSWGTISIFIKKTPLTQAEITTVNNFCSRCLFDVVYYPGITQEEANIHNRFDRPMFFTIVQELLDKQRREKFFSRNLFNLRPVTDDRPFFYNYFKWDRLEETYRALEQKWLPFLEGEMLVPLLLIQATFLAFLLIILPLIRQKKQSQSYFPRLKVLLYFGLIGLSFMFVEMILIQKFIFFFGHPLWSSSLVLFSLLFFSGWGSRFSKKIWGERFRWGLTAGPMLAAAAAGVFLFIFPLLPHHLMGKPLLVKTAAALAVIFPLGFVMGFPFPTGIRFLGSRYHKEHVSWAWAVNALAGVVGSILALLFAFGRGYTFVLLLAVMGYAGAALVQPSSFRNSPG
ncbi:MAG: hypothetical protein JXB26_06020 [Candidatus Aminicenantes bacterium]|nr:hypothetical protein [Candidatus Aminicenantes bacterium]